MTTGQLRFAFRVGQHRATDTATTYYGDHRALGAGSALCGVEEIALDADELALSRRQTEDREHFQDAHARRPDLFAGSVESG